MQVSYLFSYTFTEELLIRNYRQTFAFYLFEWKYRLASDKNIFYYRYFQIHLFYTASFPTQ